MAERKVKICGIRRMEDISFVNTALPDFIGFIFAEGRRRSISPEYAAELAGRLSPSVMPVGVFVDAAPELILETVKKEIVRMVQLHGHEDNAYIGRLKDELRQNGFGDVKIIKAVSLSCPEDVILANESPADLVLLDSGAGGTGRRVDPDLLTEIGRPFWLAGGLSPENIVETLERLERMPSGRYLQAVDTSSGTETDGVKDGKKIEAFVQTVRRKGNKEVMMTQTEGRFGIHGGRYIPETLMNAVIELEQAYDHFKNDPEFNRELTQLFNEYAGRPSRLYFAKKMTQDLGGAKIYLKREDLNHTGAHKINNVLGQALLAKKMGKTRLIAETGAGQHGVATATAAALMGMECVVFMGEEDTKRQALNVYRMRLLGSQVIPVTTGTATLKDAVSEAMREWTNRIDDTHYCLGSVMGPHPFPTIVRDFQAVISREIKEQILAAEGRLPDAVMACVGGGSNAIGTFYHFIEDRQVRLIGCEAAGRGIDTFETAATISTGREGIFHGMKSYFCQDEFGQIAPVYSISAGLDYPGVGPEHAWLHDTGRAEYVPVTDDEAVNAFEYLSRTEGIIPAIESAHAVAHAMKIAPAMDKEQILVITVSGRGDKDCAAIARYRGEDLHE